MDCDIAAFIMVGFVLVTVLDSVTLPEMVVVPLESLGVPTSPLPPLQPASDRAKAAESKTVEKLLVPA